MKTKEFSLGAVLSVTTGILVCRSFNDVHEIFDHFYPGIMTIGISMMSDKAASRVLEQYPALAGIEVPTIDANDPWSTLKSWLIEMEEIHGATFILNGDPSRETPEQNGMA